MADVSSEYWAYNDPRWAADPSYGNPETMKYMGPWDQVLQATGFTGRVFQPAYTEMEDPNGGTMLLESGQQYTPEAKAAIDQLRSSGYDLRWKHPDRSTYNTYWGFVTPEGVQDIKFEGSDVGNIIKPLIKVFGAGLGLAGLGAGINSLLGGAGAGAGNALAGGIGGLEGAAFADLAGGMLPEFGTIPAYSAGLGGGAGVLTAADLATLPDSALGQAVSAPGDSGVAGVADATSATEIRGGAGAGTGADSAAIRDSLYGAEGYGAGMTGAQTGAYDTILGATGSKTAADVASNVVGAGGSILDKAIDLIKSPAGGAILSGVGSVVGGVAQANAAEEASDQQAEAARNALALQREMFEYQKSLLEPYRTAGTAALKRLEGALGLGGPAQPQQMLEMDPGYGFRLGEGMKALERMQSARGSMLSGGAMKAGQRYAQDYASGEYNNAYNRLADIAGIGRSTAAQQGTAAQQFGTSAGNVMGQEANALAAGRIGRGSAYGNAIQGGLNAYSNYLNQQQQNQLFRDIFGRTAIGG